MTPLFQPVASFMLVGVDPETAESCAAAVPALLALRVGHAAGAVERMLVTRPLVVVVGDAVSPLELAPLRDCARDICAEVLCLSPATRGELPAAVRRAALIAERARAEKQPRS